MQFCVPIIVFCSHMLLLKGAILVVCLLRLPILKVILLTVEGGLGVEVGAWPSLNLRDILVHHLYGLDTSCLLLFLGLLLSDFLFRGVSKGLRHRYVNRL